MNATDLRYAGILSTRLERFSIKSYTPYRANCRCPICGDSQKSKIKARGWLLQREANILFYCHNCHASLGMANFLKEVDMALYNSYTMDRGLEKYESRPKKDIKPLDKLVHKQPFFNKKGSPLLKLKKISSLNFSHKAKKYIEKRQIPVSKHYKLYYTDNFNAWVNSLIPGKMPNLKEERIVLPFIDPKNKVFGFQGRALDDSSLRYITIMLDESMPKLFGLNDVDFDDTYYVVEGPIDSLFIDNCIAMAGADGNASGLKNAENAVFIFDNEPRNKQIVERMEKCIEDGYKVFIWPDYIVDKDVNDVVLSLGITSKELKSMIDKHTYSGLSGKLQISYWRKC
mgnify:FL=1